MGSSVATHRHDCITGEVGHRELDRRLWATAALNMAIAMAEILGGIFAGSLALHQEWKINHATLEPEIMGCPDTELLGQWEGAHSKPRGGPPESSS